MSFDDRFADRMRRADARIVAAVGEMTTVDGEPVPGIPTWEEVEQVVGEHIVMGRRLVLGCQISLLPAGTVKGSVVAYGDESYVIREFDPPRGDHLGWVKLVLGR